jgi:hypothetical protein
MKMHDLDQELPAAFEATCCKLPGAVQVRVNGKWWYFKSYLDKEGLPNSRGARMTHCFGECKRELPTQGAFTTSEQAVAQVKPWVWGTRDHYDVHIQKVAREHFGTVRYAEAPAAAAETETKSNA